MAYGFQIRNAAGQIVMDQDSPQLYIAREFMQQSSGKSSRIANKSDYYSFLPTVQNKAALLAVKLELGDKIFGGPRRFWSNRERIGFRELMPFPAVAPPKEAYGMQVWDATGKLVYASYANLLPASRIINFPGKSDNSDYMDNEQNLGTATVSADEIWFLFAPASSGHETTARPPGSSGVRLAYRHVGGLFRVNATQVRYIPGAITSQEIGGYADTGSYSIGAHRALVFDGA